MIDPSSISVNVFPICDTSNWPNMYDWILLKVSCRAGCIRCNCTTEASFDSNHCCVSVPYCVNWRCGIRRCTWTISSTWWPIVVYVQRWNCLLFVRINIAHNSQSHWQSSSGWRASNCFVRAHNNRTYALSRIRHSFDNCRIWSDWRLLDAWDIYRHWIWMGLSRRLPTIVGRNWLSSFFTLNYSTISNGMIGIYLRLQCDRFLAFDFIWIRGLLSASIFVLFIIIIWMLKLFILFT